MDFARILNYSLIGVLSSLVANIMDVNRLFNYLVSRLDLKFYKTKKGKFEKVDLLKTAILKISKMENIKNYGKCHYCRTKTTVFYCYKNNNTTSCWYKSFSLIFLPP